MIDHLLLLGAQTGLSVVLHQLEQAYPIKPSKVWMEVSAGVTITLLWSRWHAQRREKTGRAMTWRDYDTMIWTAFAVSGVPHILWQEWLYLPRLTQTEDV
jgi:hypothetical protein